MFNGLIAGILWALDTVILGIALNSTSFVNTSEAIMLAPFVSTFLHDFTSAIWMFIYTLIKKEYKNVIKAFKSKSAKYIMLSAIIGGPIGMSGYVSAINYIGPSYTAIISSLFPALGALLSYIFLKERMKPIQLFFLSLSITGIILLAYSPSNNEINNLFLGFLCALLCCFGWAIETVIIAHGLKDPDISDDTALMIRQLSSSLFYGIVIITFIKGWGFTLSLIPSNSLFIIALSSLFGTTSFLFYYRAISKIGAAKSMALNITYSAWAIVFSFILLKEIPNFRSVVLGLVIVVASILASTDIKELGI